MMNNAKDLSYVDEEEDSQSSGIDSGLQDLESGEGHSNSEMTNPFADTSSDAGYNPDAHYDAASGNDYTVGLGSEVSSTKNKGRFKGFFNNSSDKAKNTFNNLVSNFNSEGSFLKDKNSLFKVLILIVAMVLAGLYLTNPNDDFSDDIGLIDENQGLENFDFLPDEGQVDDFLEDPVQEVTQAFENAADTLEEAAENIEVPEALEEVIDDIQVPLDNPVPAGAIAVLQSPPNGAVRVFDDTMEPTQFEWDVPGGQFSLSKSESMSPAVIQRDVEGNSIKIRTILPGTWYWQVSNSQGGSDVWSLTIESPIPRVFSIVQPATGGSINGEGGTVTWTGDLKVSFYRVELSSGGWNSPDYRFATVGTQLNVNGVSPGSYQLRVGGFSEVSGRWEYSEPINISVQ